MPLDPFQSTLSLSSTQATTSIEMSAMRKIRRRVLPFVFTMYITAFLDRANVAFAKLDMSSQLGFADDVYGFGAGLFFIGYLLLEVPGGLIVQRWGARRWFARILFSWGLCSALMGFIHTASQFYVARFILGVAEAGFFPGVIVYLNQWFPRQYRGRAMARFIIAIPVSLALGGPVSGLILKLNWFGLSGWRWVFILEGVPAVALGFITLLYLTDRPEEARWLTNDEKKWISQELEEEKKRKSAFAKLTILQALHHRPVIFLALITFSVNIASQGFYLWLPTTVQKASGYPTYLAATISGLPFAMGILSLLFFSWSSDRFQERYWHTALPLILGGCCFTLTSIPSITFGWLLACLCATAFFYNGFSPSYWVLTTMTLSESAAAAAIGFINCFSGLGGFSGPYVIGKILGAGIPFNRVVFLISAGFIFAGVLTLLLKKFPASRRS
ncbi:MAG: MFS transporter [Terriglobia bacterium]